MLPLPYNTSAKAVKNNYKLSKSTYTTSSSLLYVNKKYIFTNSKGIYVKNSLKGKEKRIANKTATSPILSDGNKIYFVVTTGDSPEKYKYAIYSVKINGKSTTKLKSGKGPANLITCYNGSLYYSDSPHLGALYTERIKKLNLKTKKTKVISGSKTAAHTVYFNGKIYFSVPTFSVTDMNRSKVYSVDLKTEKIKSVINNASAYNYCCSNNLLGILSYKFDVRTAKTKNVYLYTVNKNNKITKSKRLSNNINVRFVSCNGKYAIYNDNSCNTYKIYLKSGVKKKLSKKIYFQHIICDMKSPSSTYLINVNSSNQIFVRKMVGDKLKKCKIAGKSYLKAACDNLWVAEGNLLLGKNNKFKYYKIK